MFIYIRCRPWRSAVTAECLPGSPVLPPALFFFFGGGRYAAEGANLVYQQGQTLSCPALVVGASPPDATRGSYSSPSSGDCTVSLVKPRQSHCNRRAANYLGVHPRLGRFTSGGELITRTWHDGWDTLYRVR